MTRKEDIDLAKGRTQVAFDRLKAAEDSLEKSNLRDALHSAYYAAYTAIRVLLNLEYEEQSKHGGNIGEFRRLYIKTQVLDASLSSYIGDLYHYRDMGDYDLDFVPKQEVVISLVANARLFVEAVDYYLKEKFFK
jgi:uncharacterized protein (UPF0332 family)